MSRHHYHSLLCLSILFLSLIRSAFCAPGLVISEFFTNPTGADSPYEYVALLATENINFANTPFAVVFTNNGTATSNGWIAGGLISYGFSLTTGSVQRGDVVYVGGSSLANGLSGTPTILRSINTVAGNGDRFGTANSGGVLGNGGTNADGIAVFNTGIANVTSSTVPVDAIFFGLAPGNAVVSGGSAGYQLPVNDRYSGGKLTSGSFVGPEPVADDRIKSSGVFNTNTNTWTTARTWTATQTPSIVGASGISLSGGVIILPEPASLLLIEFSLPIFLISLNISLWKRKN